MTGAEAYPYNNNDNDHEDKFKYKPSFGKSDGKSSSSASFKCTNINLNFPGLDFSPTFPSNGDDNNGEEDLVANAFGGNNGQNNGGNNGFKSFEKDGVIAVCINANDNSVRGGIDRGEEPEPTTGTLKVTKQITCDDSRTLEGDCEELLELITEDQFTFQVEGNNPDPSSPFPGSPPPTGTDVTLGPGNYVVTETREDSVIDAALTFLENNADRNLRLLIDSSSFTDDCTFSGQLGTEVQASGTIAAGESQTCNAINAFTITSEPIPPE